MGFEVRPIAVEEANTFRSALMRTFGEDLPDEEGDTERFLAIVKPQRTYAAFDGTVMVGTSAAFDFELAVPGGLLPMAGFTMAGVQPTHRRRGILRAMMTAHFDDARSCGDVLSGLWASETAIYPRFGFGLAAEGHIVQIATPGLEIRGSTLWDQVDLVEEDDARDRLPPLYAAIRPHRPGMLSRSEPWWEHRRFHDSAARRRGRSSRRYAIASRGAEITGYAVYRQRSEWDDGIPTGKLEVEELLSTDSRAEATLWRFLVNVDLFPNVSWWNAPVDSILPWLASDRRRIQRKRADTLWLRLLDIPLALEARSYLGDGMLRLAIRDRFRRSDTPNDAGADQPDTEIYELRVEAGVRHCTRGQGTPDLVMDVNSLASIYLGGVAPSLLARVGLIEGGPTAVTMADKMFLWPVAPWCPEIF